MLAKFKHRSSMLERLDLGEYTPEEYRLWQSEMRFINGILGEVRALRRTLVRDFSANGSTSVSILDVGAGSGELLRQLRKLTGSLSTFAVGVEINPAAAKSIKLAGFPAVQCDAMSLPFTDGAFDYVICTLFLHHLEDRDAAVLLGEMGRVAAKNIYVVDLDRQPIPYYLYKVFGPIFFQRFTIEDGLLSILRCRSADELIDLAASAGLVDLRVERSRANRLILSGK